ncbi:CopG family transcriptional regulator [Candidatus Poribacteria bacterium]|nr:CopG family transcriptional regulator [Candidatus Poribacteria bacterium]
MKAICTELPDQLYKDVKFLVDKGWFRNEDDVILEALRRFLDTHKIELMENFIKDDVQWGLYGKE